MLTLVLTLILQAAQAKEPAPNVWSLSIVRSGGFRGSFPSKVVAISSENASPELIEAVRAAKPQQWTASYAPAANPSGCCDQYKLDFELRIHGEKRDLVYKTHWYEASHVSIPPDLVKILRLAQRAKAN